MPMRTYQSASAYPKKEGCRYVPLPVQTYYYRTQDIALFGKLDEMLGILYIFEGTY
jgi:hypothetical protein